jgi:membrane fusion protein (multidrug efflux system)
MPQSARLRTFVFALFILSGALALNACKVQMGADAAKAGANANAKKGPDAVPVEVVKVQRRAINASYANSATLDPRADSQVVAKTSGVALQVLVEEGQQVKQGQALVQLDSNTARLAVAQAEAQMMKLENSYARSQKLVAKQLISANDLDAIKFDLDNARAQYGTYKLQLSYTTVVAPISGVIASRSIKPGNFVQINSPIFRIVDNSRLEATLNVAEREFSRFKPGQKVSLTVDALPGQQFTGVVDRVSPVVDSGTGTFRVVSAFAGDGQLKAGMYSHLSINYDQRTDALVIPRSALLEDGGEPAVYVIRDNKAQRVSVKLGYDDAGYVEVRDGLKEGDAVVIAGKAALREGSAVQVLGGDAKTSDGKPAAQAAQ